MKKPNIFDLLADIPQKEIDENAFSVDEMALHQKCSRTTIGRLVSKMVATGKWQKVWKRGNQGALIPAYRKATK